MSSLLVPPVLAALVIMVSFALIPRRLWFLQLPAVIAWAVVWTDNRITTDWADLTGLAVVASCGVALCMRWQRRPGSGGSNAPSGHARR